MRFLENDQWQGEFVVEKLGIYYYTLQGWVDHFKTWQKDLRKKFDAGQDIRVDILIGVEYIEEAAKRARVQTSLRLPSTKLRTDFDLAQDRQVQDVTSSQSSRDGEKKLVEFAEILKKGESVEKAVETALSEELTVIMEKYPDKKFATLYTKELPVVVDRVKARFSAWYERFPRSCSSEPGRHGTLEDFEALAHKAKDYGIEIAIDLAYQCTPDHPYVKEHPEWFRKRPDGTIQYAENPPKKYQDIFPLNFETEHWRELWEELKSIVLFWIENGVHIFRVDNPHTKAFPFWEWLIIGIKREYPEVIFLSEAFTRPKVMYHLAKLRFTQSYTYFTWRNTKRELTEYLTELTQIEVREYFRPNFWPNPPNILPEHLQYGGRPAFMMRLVLAATLSSNYGIYGPAFELCVGEALPGREEYLDSEKYELKHWDWNQPGDLRDFIARVNRIRKENPALHTTGNLRFYEVDKDDLLFYGKATEDLSNMILVAVNLDPFHTQSGWVRVPLKEFGIAQNQPYLVHDLISDDKYIWQGERHYVELSPRILPVHPFRVRKRLRKETDFDYFM